MDFLSEPPVRLCCGQRHLGAQCPDGFVMCCHCFSRFPVSQLATDEHGDKIDVCQKCNEKERTQLPPERWR